MEQQPAALGSYVVSRPNSSQAQDSSTLESRNIQAHMAIP